jgi:hypothetical protein
MVSLFLNALAMIDAFDFPLQLARLILDNHFSTLLRRLDLFQLFSVI